jgi:hypothetical protein
MMSGLSLNKVKIALTLLSIGIIVGPLAGIMYVYRDNLVGLVFPPQVQSLLSGGGSSGSQGSQLSQDLSDFKLSQSGEQLQYNPSTGVISYPFNFTNPLNTPISFDQMSAEVVSGNNVSLGTLSIQPTTIAPGANEIINATGNLSQSAISQLAQNSGATNLNIGLENVNVDVGGVKVHINQINNFGSIPTG